MLNGRLYRTAFLPLAPVLVIIAFSLHSQPAPLTTTLGAQAFSGAQAETVLDHLEADFPDRRPGSRGDARLATFIANRLAHPAGQSSPAAPGLSSQEPSFSVQVRRSQAQTIDGSRTLETVIATRPGSESGQIVVLAHRDAAYGGSEAELSATAALLELSQVLSANVTRHTITLVSTSGGSGGDAGAYDFAVHHGGPVDAVIVLGDLAGAIVRKPIVVAWSDGLGSAPVLLTRTLQSAISSEVGTNAGSASVFSQFAHLAVPFAVGEQGVLDARGLPAVLVQVSGEQGPSAHESVSPRRLQDFGRAVLRAVYAVDQAPGVGAPSAALLVRNDVVPSWAVRLLVAALLFPALVASVDALARVRRRGELVGLRLRWVLGCAAPFMLAALFAVALGQLGLIDAPAVPTLPQNMPVDAVALAVGLAVLVAAALVLRRALRALGVTGGADSAATGMALLLVLDALALVVWFLDPYAGLLLLGAVHLWPVVADPQLRPRVPVSLALVIGGIALPAGVIALYAHQLGMGPIAVAWMALLLAAGGHVGVAVAALWSVGLGCLAAVTLIALRGVVGNPEPPPVTVRGPVSYAGPGSLGGTESALRR